MRRNVDDQAPPTGYIYRADGGTEGSVGTFDWQINGAFYYDNFAPYLVNHGHSGPRRDGLSMPTGSPETINADPTLMGLGVVAIADAEVVRTNGDVTEVLLEDEGLAPKVPSLSPAAAALLAALLAAGGGMTASRWRGVRPPIG